MKDNFYRPPQTRKTVAAYPTSADAIMREAGRVNSISIEQCIQLQRLMERIAQNNGEQQ